MNGVEGLQKRLGYGFKDQGLLRAALTHPSQEKSNKKASTYERLEFLGDRVLSLLIAEWLYELYPDESEGKLAKRHAALVNRDILAAISERLGLASILQLLHPQDLVRGRVNILSDALEALMGAIYRDAGEQGLEVMRVIVKELWKDDVHNTLVPQDPKSALQEWAQARGYKLPEYKVVSQTGPAHAPHYLVSVKVETQEEVAAEGTSKREAEKKAAADLWKRLSG
jgi:ribonuclease-3